jgi:integrase
MNTFLEWSGKTPNGLISMQRKAMRGNGDPRLNHEVENLVRKWISYLGESKKPATCRTALNAVRNFFMANEHPLRILRKDIPQGATQGSNVPEREDVIKMADASTWKYRAIIMFLKDSGLRISDVVRLRWEDMQDMGDGFWHFTIETEKKGIVAMSFVGPETTRVLARAQKKEGRIFPARPQFVTKKLSQAIKSCGLTGIYGHGLRKYFYASMQEARVPEHIILLMMGKKSSEYGQRRVSELLKYYKDAYSKLGIYGQVKTNLKIRRQEAQIKKLRERVDELTRQYDLLEYFTGEDAIRARTHITKLLRHQKSTEETM